MMVTSTLIAELEAVRVALAAEQARIRQEYETRLPDIESDLAAVDRLLRHGAGWVAETAPDVPEVDQPVQEAPEATQDTPDAAVDAVTAPALADTAPDDAAPVRAERTAPVRPNWRRELAGLRQEAAAVKVAEWAGSTVTVADVARVLMEVGLTRATGALANGQASKMLSESLRFERVGRGVYRLVAGPVSDASEPPTTTSEA